MCNQEGLLMYNFVFQMMLSLCKNTVCYLTHYFIFSVVFKIMLGKWYLAHCSIYFAKLEFDGWLSFTVYRRQHTRVHVSLRGSHNENDGKVHSLDSTNSKPCISYL